MHSTPPEPRRAAGKRDVVKLAREQNVRFVRLVFADIFGVSKNVSIPVGELENALEGRVTFDGGSIDGVVRGEELDMRLRPDATTFAIYPWPAPEGREARLICDIAMPDGQPFEGCPRTTLRRAVESAGALAGLQVGLEVEFYLFARAPGSGALTSTSDVGSYFDFSANDRGEEARNAIVAALQSMGVPVASAHHEHGAGQHEIDVAHDAPLAAADHALTLRTLAKHVAAAFDLDATFMPKPLEDRAGSGLHVDFRLGVGADEPTALYVVGGLLAHAPAATAICNPTVNSVQAPRGCLGCADLYGLVAPQRQCPRARASRTIAAARRDAQPGSGVQPVSGVGRPNRRCGGRSSARHVARSAPGRLDVRPRRAGATRARNRHAAEIIAPSYRRTRPRRRGARGVGGPSFPRISRR